LFRSTRLESSSVAERAKLMAAVGDRIAALDWDRIEGDLNERGFALTGNLLHADQCARLIALYEDRERFRSRIEMARFHYGVGEYKYFAEPLPALVGELRVALYRRLAPIANRWSKLLGGGQAFPGSVGEYLKACHAAGQCRPTPLLLRYQAGGYNCLHQDLYGELAFPLQFTCLLSQRGSDYEGGESLLVEQRPRAQSRGEAIALDLGAALIFPNRFRPVAGARGYKRVNVRHGVSTVRRGERYALGIIFHDAK
jgi:uncharacterized protein